MNLCNLCGSKNLFPLIYFGKHPIAHYYLDKPTQEEYLHSVDLHFCQECGLTQLVDPVPPDMFYTNYLTLSAWKYQPHIYRLLDLIEKFPGIKKTSKIVEIGCNDGIFCKALIDRGYQEVIGIEPALDAQEAARQRGIEVVGGYFTTERAKQVVEQYGQCQLVVTRQVLEHISNLKAFQEALQIILAPDGYILIEVPNFGCNLTNLDYGLWEEHVNYFTLETLENFLVTAGIKLIHSETILYSSEALVVTGQYSKPSPMIPVVEYLSMLSKQVLSYQKLWPEFCQHLITFLDEYRNRDKKIAIYGASNRVNSLINFTGIGSYIEFVLDDQFEKQGKYMPGSRLPIISGDQLELRSIDLCLLAVNTENDAKVMANHSPWQEQGGYIYSILPPGTRLPPFWKEMISEQADALHNE